MNNAKFHLLGELIKRDTPISGPEFMDLMSKDINLKQIDDRKEFNASEFWQDYFENVDGDPTVNGKYKLKDTHVKFYHQELAKRQKEATREQIEEKTLKSNINANLFISLTFVLSMFGLLVQMYSVRIQSQQTKILEKQLQSDTLQSQQQTLQDALLIEHSRVLDSLRGVSSKDTTKSK